jgi:hypothetical protein
MIISSNLKPLVYILGWVLIILILSMGCNSSKKTAKSESVNNKPQFDESPEIVTSSTSVHNLYANCGNDLFIKVPDLGDYYNPKISATGARVVASKRFYNKFRIIPTEDSCQISVSSITNGELVHIGDLNYKVIQPPKPSIEWNIDEKMYRMGAFVSKTSSITVRLIPDPDFKSGFPEEAGYGIKSIDVFGQLSIGPPTKVNSINTSGRNATELITIPLGTQIQAAKEGTGVFIKLNDIYRVNFMGQRISDDRFYDNERMLAFRVR